MDKKGSNDPEEEQIMLEEQWPHIQIVYELLLRIIILKNLEPNKMYNNYVTPEFIMSLIDLFRSPDPRERDYLKTIIHRIYGKCMVSRILIRQAITRSLIFDSYQENTDDVQVSYGNAEFLEILSSIIDGWSDQLKIEHKQIFEQCLLPMHRSPFIGNFRP